MQDPNIPQGRRGTPRAAGHSGAGQTRMPTCRVAQKQTQSSRQEYHGNCPEFVFQALTEKTLCKSIMEQNLH